MGLDEGAWLIEMASFGWWNEWLVGCKEAGDDCLWVGILRKCTDSVCKTIWSHVPEEWKQGCLRKLKRWWESATCRKVRHASHAAYSTVAGRTTKLRNQGAAMYWRIQSTIA